MRPLFGLHLAELTVRRRVPMGLEIPVRPSRFAGDGGAQLETGNELTSG